MEAVAPTPWGTGEHVPPLLQMAGHGGTASKKSKQETDQTVLTITKVLTKTTCALRAKKWRGARPKKFPAPDRCPPTFKFVPPGTTGWKPSVGGRPREPVAARAFLSGEAKGGETF